MHVALDDLTGLKAPDFGGGGTWINSEPLSLKELRGKAVLVDFWTYSCVNCLRTMPYLKDWYRKYSGKGLVIVGVHSPEFDFEKDVNNVLNFVRENGIEYPVVLDNDHAIWQAYANRYWPRELLVDGAGYIRHDHIGEGSYVDTEEMIQKLLREDNPKIRLPKIETAEHEHRPGSLCHITTPEVYAGYYRGLIGNPEGYAEDSPSSYEDTRKHEDGRIYLQGAWEAKAQFVQHARSTHRPQDYVAIPYHALEVNAVMMPAGGRTVKVHVTRDGHKLEKRVAGKDVIVEDGKSFVVVDAPRMYNIVKDHEYAAHTLKLATSSNQLQIYSFTFGGCKQ